MPPTLEKLDSVQILTSTTQARNVCEKHIVQKAKGASEGLKILEAGCGREWILDLGEVEYELTGVDLDEHALSARMNQIKDLDKAAVGDLCSVELAEDTYDVIFNAYVLEHIKGAEVVLSNFNRWLKEDGLLILLFPSRSSVYGFLTRLTPHWIHVIYLRYLSPWKNKNAGKSGFGPYPTYHDAVVSREGIRRFCRDNGFTMEAEYASNTYITQSSGLKAVLLKAVVKVIYWLSLGRLEPRYNNLIYVLRKGGTARADFTQSDQSKPMKAEAVELT